MGCMFCKKLISTKIIKISLTKFHYDNYLFYLKDSFSPVVIRLYINYLPNRKYHPIIVTFIFC